MSETKKLFLVRTKAPAELYYELYVIGNSFDEVAERTKTYLKENYKYEFESECEIESIEFLAEADDNPSCKKILLI